MRLMAEYFQTLGLRLSIYLENAVFKEQNCQSLMTLASLAMNARQNLGFIINILKTELCLRKVINILCFKVQCQYIRLEDQM